MDFQSAMETFAEAWVAANTKGAPLSDIATQVLSKLSHLLLNLIFLCIHPLIYVCKYKLINIYYYIILPPQLFCLIYSKSHKNVSNYNI